VTARRFPPPWSVEELDACFVVRDRGGQANSRVWSIRFIVWHVLANDQCGITQRELKNMRTASLIVLSGLLVQVAHADEIRHAAFPDAMLGTWAETAEQCAAKDKTNIVIEPAKYRDGGGDCEVRWIVETEGADGINYAVHSLCTSASLPEKTQIKDIIVRPLGPDRAAMGRSFEDLKSYQRCP
jgi:hypothetical protein